MNFRKIALFFRHKKFKNVRVKNEDITILCNNCTAGTMYNDLMIRFNTPTINLYFGTLSDFYFFCVNLKKYVDNGFFTKTDLIESKKGFPNASIGLLKCEGLPSLEIHFLHYKSFEEGVKKWNERCKRINFKKIFILIEATNENAEQLKMFDNFIYPITAFTNKETFLEFSNVMPFYEKYGADEKHPILKMVNIFGKRGYDSFDFVEKIFNFNFNNGEKL